LSERQRHLLKSPDSIGDNPVNVYKFVHLYTEDWDSYISDYITSSQEQGDVF